MIPFNSSIPLRFTCLHRFFFFTWNCNMNLFGRWRIRCITCNWVRRNMLQNYFVEEREFEKHRKVSESIQIGARAIKEIGISVEEVQLCLQELDESVAVQKEVEEALESVPLHPPDMEDESVLVELKNLELVLEDEIPQSQISGIPVDTLAKGGKDLESSESVSNSISKHNIPEGAAEKVDGDESAESLSNNFSNLKLEAA